MTDQQRENIDSAVLSYLLFYPAHHWLRDNPDVGIEDVLRLLTDSSASEMLQGLRLLVAARNPAWGLWLLERPALFCNDALLGALCIAKKWPLIVSTPLSSPFSLWDMKHIILAWATSPVRLNCLICGEGLSYHAYIHEMSLSTDVEVICADHVTLHMTEVREILASFNEAQ